MNPYRLIAAQLLKILNHLPGAAKEIEQKQYLRLARDVVCYNQGKIADYSFSANESHKELKRCYQHIENNTGSAQASDYESLKNAYTEISHGLAREFKAYAQANFEYMDKFYKAKNFNRKPARFCVKSAVPDGVGSTDGLGFEILTLAGSELPYRESSAYSVRESTGFTQVILTGNYCLRNNIPESVRKEGYVNSRIIRDEFFRYYQPPGWLKNLRYRFTSARDNSWERCWKTDPVRSRQDVPSSSYYKSTLIVPLSLSARAGDLSKAFLKNFDVQEEKIILGFLCTDHENINFFNEKGDVDFSYIIADQLSLYLIHYWICTNYSSIFQKSHDLLKRQGCLD